MPEHRINSKHYNMDTGSILNIIICSDISHNEHVYSIQWVNSQYEIDLLSLVQLPDTKGETLFQVIKDVLIRCSLPIVLCRGQAYDAASNMSGVRNGVQALVKHKTDRALYVHCFAHSLCRKF